MAKMRLVVILMGLTSVLTNSKKIQPIMGFEEGMKYTYQYYASYATGVLGEEKQFKGNGFSGSIIVQFNNGVLCFKGSNFKIGPNVNVDGSPEKRNLDDGEQKDRADKLSVLSSELEKPFQAKYENGVLNAIYVEADDILNSVNIKRALLGLLQLNLEPLQTLGKDSYNIKEDGIAGVSLTSYKVAQQPLGVSSEVQGFNVTKSRSYGAGDYRPSMSYSSVYGSKCEKCDKVNLTRHGDATYQLKGTQSNYTINRIDSSGVIQLSVNGQNIVSIVNQTLTLVNVEQSRSALSCPLGQKKYDSLEFEFSNMEDYIDTEDCKKVYYDNFYGSKDDKPVQKAKEYLKHIEVNDAEKNLKMMPILISCFRTFSRKDFTQFFPKHVMLNESNGNGERDNNGHMDKDFGSFLFCILPFVGTNDSILFMIDMIKNSSELNKSTSMFMLSKFPFHVMEPSKKLLELMSAFKPSSASIEGVAVMSFGNLIWKSCVADVFNPHPRNQAPTYVDEATCKRMIDKLNRKLMDKIKFSKRASDHVRALANTRHEHACDLLLKIAKDVAGITHNDRSIAINALRPCDEKDGDKVAKAVSPIFYNTSEDTQIRIYAFEALLNSVKFPEIMQELLPKMKTEPNVKVSNYVYATFHILSNTTDPCMEQFKPPIQENTPITPKNDMDMAANSTTRLFKTYNPKLNCGRSTRSLVMLNSSFIPQNLHLNLSVDLFGSTFNVLQVGSNEASENQKNQLINGFFAQQSRSNEPGKEDDVLEREGESPSESKVDVYVKNFGQYIFSGDFRQFLNTGDTTSNSQGKTNIADSKTNFKIFSKFCDYYEMKLFLCNEMGLPTILELKSPAIYNLSGEVENKVDIKDPKQMNRVIDIKFNISINFNANARMLVYSKEIGTAGFNQEMKARVGLPVKQSVYFDYEKQQVNSTYVPSAVQYDVIYNSQSTFSKSTDSNMPVSNTKNMTEQMRNFDRSVPGIGLKFNFTYDVGLNVNVSLG